MSETDGIIRQIDEEIKRERVLKLFSRFKYHVLGVVGSVLVLVWGGTTYVDMKEQRAQEQGRQFLTALAKKDAPLELLASLEPLLKDGSDSYKALAKFQQAAVLAKRGDSKPAKKLYQNLESTAPTADLRDLASLMWVYVAFEENVDVTPRLEKLMKSTWRDLAYELKAFLALKNGDEKTAREMFETLDAESNSPGIQRRSSEMLILLGTNNE